MENKKLSDVNSKSGSELIAIAHGIAANFESPATELLCELASRLECSIIRGDELQQKLDAMAAENSALKCKNLIGYVKDADVADVANGRVGSLMPNDVFGEKPVYLSVETPATDSYMNSVRAEGVEMFAKHCDDSIGLVEPEDEELYTLMEEQARNYAASLRSGTHDTADKEGAK